MRALVLRLFLPFAAVSSIALHPGDALSQVICGGVLMQDAVLSADLNCEGDGLRLGADGITLDCGGHAIQGEGQADSAGIRLAGVRGATIRNCRISGFRTQIQAEDSPDLAILGDHLSAGPRARGLTIRRSAGLLITSSRVDESLLAVYLDSCPDATLIGNQFEPPADPEIWRATVYSYDSPRLTFRGNRSEGGADLFMPHAADGTVVMDNDLAAGHISAYFSTNVVIANNRLRPSRGDRRVFGGVQLVSSRGCKVADNIVRGARIYGVFLTPESAQSPGAEENVVSGNLIEDASYGILILGASENEIANNRMAGADIAILVESFLSGPRADRNDFVGNSIVDSMYGILVADASGNSFQHTTISGGAIGIADYLLDPPLAEPNVYADNEVTGSSFFGMVAIGGSPIVKGNEFTGNGNGTAPLPPDIDPVPALAGGLRGGLLVLPFDGNQDSWDDGNPENDFVPAPTLGGPGVENVFTENGNVDIYSIDAPLGDLSAILDGNVFRTHGPEPSNDHLRVRQDRFGLIHAEDFQGAAISGAVVDLFDSAGRAVVSFTSGPDGFAPSGVDPERPQGRVAWEPGGPTPPWPRITEYVVDHAGRRRDLTPHGFRIRTEDGAGHSGYSWNGLDDDPNGYRIFQGRYQTARARTGNACLAFADLAQAISSADISNQGIRKSLLAKSAEAEREWARSSGAVAGNGLCAVLAEVGAQRGGGISIPSTADLCACTDELAESLDIPMECGGP